MLETSHLRQLRLRAALILSLGGTAAAITGYQAGRYSLRVPGQSKKHVSDRHMTTTTFGRRASELLTNRLRRISGGFNAQAKEEKKTAADPECGAIIQKAMDADEDIVAVRKMGGGFHEISVEYPNPRICEGSEDVLYGRAVWSDVAADGRLFTPMEKRPVVFVVHAACGQLEDFITWRLQSLAANGYVAFAVDMYGCERALWSANEFRPILNNLYEDRSIVVDRFLAGVNAAESRVPPADVTRAATLGYCLGGMVVLDVVRSGVVADLRAAVSFHGILDAPSLFDQSQLSEAQKATKVQVYHGQADPFIPPQKLEAFKDQMQRLGMDWMIREYPGVSHAFTRPEKIRSEDYAKGFGYDEAAATESWTRARATLREVFLE